MFTVCHGKEAVKTPAGKVVQSENELVLRRMIQDMQELPTLPLKNGIPADPRPTSVYYLFSTLVDFLDEGKGLSAADIRHLLEHDPIFYPSAGPEWPEQLSAWEGARKFLDDRGHRLRPRPAYSLEEWTSLGTSLASLFETLSRPQRAAVDSLRTLLDGTVVFALAFVTNSLEPNEYAHAVLAASLAHAGIFGFPGGRKSPEKVHQEAFAAIKRTAQTAQDFLGCFEDPIKALIESGENRRMEFKSTLRRNLKTGLSDDAVTHAVLKTIAAFLNSEGGILLIGVRDTGEAIGLEADSFESDDKFLLHLHNKISTTMGASAEAYVDHHIVKSAEKRVCKVECRPAPQPVFLTPKGGQEEEFYIRTGPATTRLGPRELLKYTGEHFRSTSLMKNRSNEDQVL